MGFTLWEKAALNRRDLGTNRRADDLLFARKNCRPKKRLCRSGRLPERSQEAEHIGLGGLFPDRRDGDTIACGRKRTRAVPKDRPRFHLPVWFPRAAEKTKTPQRCPAMGKEMGYSIFKTIWVLAAAQRKSTVLHKGFAGRL